MAVGIPLPTNYTDGDVWSASDVNDITGTINLIGYGAPVVAGKNVLINGGMDIWQRGISSSSTGYQTVDRWYGNWTGSATYSQETTTVPTGSRYALKMAATATAQLYANQAIETSNAVRFVGQNVTFSIYAQGSTSIPMSLVVYYSTNVDQPLTSSWTTITPTSGGTGTAVSGSFTRISGVWAIPSTAKSVMVQFNTTSTIASGAYVIVGQTQLELGTTASTFSMAGGTIGGELALCQRYYYVHAVGATVAIGVGYNETGSSMGTHCKYAVTMRTGPSLVVATGTDYYTFYRNGANDNFNSFIQGASGPQEAAIYNNSEISGTAGHAGNCYTNNANAMVAFNAEL